MTPTAKLLRQTPSLCRSALAHTRDVNEAYLLVHTVMVRALGGAGAPDADLALASAIAARAARLDLDSAPA